jgi:hypothetical protein
MAERVSLCTWAGLVSWHVPRTDVNPRSVSPLGPAVVSLAVRVQMVALLCRSV